MPAVSETIVREYFETLGFLVQQPCKYIVQARAKRPTEEVDFLAVNPPAAEAPARPEPDQMVATGSLLRQLPRLMVSVRGWHTDRFSPATLDLAPEIFRFTEKSAEREAVRVLGPGPLAKVLCLPGLPSTPALASQALHMLREKNVDYVVLFPTMLRELVRHVEVSKNYEKSELLQILRILKNYDLLKDEQLELFRRKKAKPGHATGSDPA